MSDPEEAAIPPDDAFNVLGDETRMEILQTLGEADESLSFSELRERVGIRDSGQFNYHLDKLKGHFVQKTEAGYALERSGERVIQAVLSGAVTETPELAPTAIEKECVYCGEETVVSFRDGHLNHYCTECSGSYGDKPVQGGEKTLGFLGRMPLPPAGLRDRTPDTLFETTAIWGSLDVMAVGRGVCPRCSAPIEQTVSVCEDHDPSGGTCDECGFHDAVLCRTACSNCTVENEVPLTVLLVADPDLLAFLGDYGIDPMTNWADLDWDEEIVSTDPFEARFTCHVEDAQWTTTIDESLEFDGT